MDLTALCVNKRTWEPQGNFNDLRKGQQRVEKVKGQVGNPTAPGSHLIASQQISRAVEVGVLSS